MSAGHSATTSSLTVWTLALSGMLSGPVERTGTGSSRYQDLARVAFGARVEHPEGGDGGLGAARCGDVGARDVPRFPERPARDPRRARRRERDGNPRAYRQPGARLGARGDTFLRAVPGAGATLADEEIWRGRGSSGARTYVDALGHPETNLRLGHRVLFVLALTDPPDPPISPCPPAALSPAPRPRRKLPGSAFGSRACAAPLSTIRRRDPSARVYHATDDTSGVRSRVARRSAREGE